MASRHNLASNLFNMKISEASKLQNENTQVRDTLRRRHSRQIEFDINLLEQPERVEDLKRHVQASREVEKLKRLPNQPKEPKSNQQRD